jgi:hypothetical protein
MNTLATILGLGGVVLVLVGMVGGGFTFSGTVMPRVGKVARLPCIVVGLAMVFLAIGVAVYEAAPTSTPDDGAVAATLPPAAPTPAVEPDPQPEPQPEPVPEPPPAADEPVIVPPPVPAAPATGTMLVDAYVYQEPYLAALVVGQVGVGTPVPIICTSIGELVMRPDGVSSQLWDSIGTGFVPDVIVNTQTLDAVAPPC